MAQRRGGQRGVANLVTSGMLLLFGALGFAAGCSAEQGAESEPLASSEEAQLICTCPKTPPPPCTQYVCVKTSCVTQPLEDGT